MQLQHLSRDIQAWPLWSQLLLLITIVLVAHFWLGKLLGTIQLRGGWLSSPLINLIKYAGLAAALSWLGTNFCLGVNAAGTPYEWGFYGRILFLIQTGFYTNLFLRYLA